MSAKTSTHHFSCLCVTFAIAAFLAKVQPNPRIEQRVQTILRVVEPKWRKHVSEIESLDLNGKSAWSRLASTANSIYYELSPEDRIAVADLTTREIEGRFPRWEDNLFSIVINDYIINGRSDLLEDLLARGGSGGLFCPLTVILNDEGLHGRIPGGIDLLFRAYDRAAPQVKPIVKLRFNEFYYILDQAGKSLDDPDSIEWIRNWIKQQKGPIFGHCGMCTSGWSSPMEAPVLLPMQDYLKACRIERKWSPESHFWFKQDLNNLRWVPQQLHPSNTSLPEWFESMKQVAESGIDVQLSFSEPTYVGPCADGVSYSNDFVFDITLTATTTTSDKSKWTSRVRILTMNIHPMYLGIP